jgi:hypothetical protein
MAVVATTTTEHQREEEEAKAHLDGVHTALVEAEGDTDRPHEALTDTALAAVQEPCGVAEARHQ